MSTNGARLDLHQLAQKNGYPDPDGNDHTCPGCGHPIDCEWKTIARLRREATHLVMQARHREAALHGQPLGKQRNREFSVEEAKALLERLGSFNAVAHHLGVQHQTVKRALEPLGLTSAGRKTGQFGARKP